MHHPPISTHLLHMRRSFVSERMIYIIFLETANAERHARLLEISLFVWIVRPLSTISAIAMYWTRTVPFCSFEHHAGLVVSLCCKSWSNEKTVQEKTIRDSYQSGPW